MESTPPPPQQQQRLLPLVVVFLFVVGALPVATHEATSSPHLHPVVLVPGNTCGQLIDARLTDEYEPPTPASCCGGVR